MSLNHRSNQDSTDVVSLDSGIEALQQSPEFQGSVEPLDRHTCNEHLAHIYEDPAEQVATAIPFLRQGIERGERCMYVIDEFSEAEIVGAMRDAGVDVDEALESGQLSFHTVDETYLRGGRFDPDEMVEFYADTVDEVAGEYGALRISAETTWMRDASVALEDFMEYESKVNRLFDEENVTAICHYDRTAFSPEVVLNIVRTHPHLIYDGTVCHNFYYTPPSEFFEPEEAAREVDRMMGTLLERTEAKVTLQERQRYQRKLYEITADPDLSFEEKIEQLLELGCERFDLELGGLNRVDPEADLFQVEYTSGDHEHFEVGAELPLSETFCSAPAEVKEATSVTDPVDEGLDDVTVYGEFGVRTYLGTYIPVDGGVDRTFAFVASESRAESFSGDERTFLELMGQWVQYELERKQRERELRERTEHLSALVETTPECIKTVADDGTLLQMNSAGLEMVEADAESDVIGECVYDLIAPEHRERFREFNERVCSGERETLEFDVVGLEGTRRHMETHAAPLHRPDGTTAHVALTRDVTERKERERRLEQHRAYTNDLLDAVDDMFYVVDEQGALQRWNETGRAVTGYSEEELASVNVLEFFEGTDRDRISEGVAEVFERGSNRVEADFVTKDGESIPYEFTASALEDPDGNPVVVGIGRDVSERITRERSQRELYEITTSTDLTFDEQIEGLLELGCERFDLDQGYLTKYHADEGIVENEFAVGPDDEDLRTGVPEAQPEPGQFCRCTLEAGEAVGTTDAGERGWDDDPVYEESGTRSYFAVTVTDGAGVYGTLPFCDTEPREEPFSDAERAFLELLGQWVSHLLEQRRREEQLAALNDMSRAVMAAETDEEIAEIAVEYTGDSLALPLTAVVTYDGATGELSPAAQTPCADDRLPTAGLCDRDDGALWDAFVSGEVRVLDDVASIAGAGDDVTETVAVPLDQQGLFVTATTADGGFSGATREFVETTAATVEAAFTRADREQQLQERERTLEEQNETLERLNRVNDIIRDIDQALVRASTRDEVGQVVCEQLADVGPYELAWIGKHDAVTGEIEPAEWAGAEKGYFDDVTVSTDESQLDQGPIARAVETGESQIVDDVLKDASYEPWRQAALNRGYHATMALPLVYEGSLYGVLSVYAGQPGVFDGLERTVLDELSDTIAYVINAVESRKALVSEAVTVLEFAVEDERLGVLELARELDCTFRQESVVPRSDGGVRAFFSTSGCPAEEVLGFADRLPATDVALISEYEEDGEPACLFEADLSGDSLTETVLDHGGRLRTLAVEDGTARMSIELAADAAVREFVEMFTTEYPDSELVAQRSRERTRRSPTEHRVALTDELTARQLEALQTAYFAGYFEQPRTQSGSDVAETLGVSQPTFNSHLRTAQRKVCRQLFDAKSA